MGKAHISVNHKNKHNKRAIPRNPACSIGGFISPTAGSSVDSLVPLNITWEKSCFTTSPSLVDIYLYAPGTVRSQMFNWQAVPFEQGSYSATLMPRWWNATQSQSLQLTMVEKGTPPFMSSLPAGPVFTATYKEPASGKPPSADTSISDNGTSVVNAPPLHKKGISPGAKAAAVLVPLLFIILAAGAYFKWQRSKGVKERKRWSEAVDKRMSTISTDWKSLSAAGATAAIRNSMAVGNRESAYAFGGVRPMSSVPGTGVGVESGHAGIGASGLYMHNNSNLDDEPNYNNDDEAENDSPEMSQMRPGVGLRLPRKPVAGAERVSRVSFAADTRVSRVSFAADTRPSGESRRSYATSRAFGDKDGYIPPVPSRLNNAATTTTATPQASDGSLSPRQTQGPLTLTPEDIRARIASGNSPGRSRAASSAGQSARSDEDGQMDEVMPALSMMRTANNSTDSDFLFSPPSPPPAVALPATTTGNTYYNNSTPATPMSPVMSSLTMQQQPIPAAYMSPDDMLRAYAEQRRTTSTAPSAYPSSPSTPSNAGFSFGEAIHTGVGLKKKKSIALGGSKAVSISYPIPVAHVMPVSSPPPQTTTMRVLYDQTQHQEPQHAVIEQGWENQTPQQQQEYYQQAYDGQQYAGEEQEYDLGDAYVGTAA